jgi:hypothetical protein
MLFVVFRTLRSCLRSAGLSAFKCTCSGDDGCENEASSYTSLGSVVGGLAEEVHWRTFVPKYCPSSVPLLTGRDGCWYILRGWGASGDGIGGTPGVRDRPGVGVGRRDLGAELNAVALVKKFPEVCILYPFSPGPRGASCAGVLRPFREKLRNSFWEYSCSSVATSLITIFSGIRAA